MKPKTLCLGKESNIWVTPPALNMSIFHTSMPYLVLYPLSCFLWVILIEGWLGAGQGSNCLWNTGNPFAHPPSVGTTGINHQAWFQNLILQPLFRFPELPNICAIIFPPLKTRSHVAQAGLKLINYVAKDYLDVLILLPLRPKCFDYIQMQATTPSSAFNKILVSSKRYLFVCLFL